MDWGAGCRGGGREGAAVDGLRRGVDGADAGVGVAEGVEEEPGRVQVDAEAVVEGGLGAGGHDAVEDVDGGRGWLGGDDGGGRRDEVGGHGPGVFWVFDAGGDGGFGYVG